MDDNRNTATPQNSSIENVLSEKRVFEVKPPKGTQLQIHNLQEYK